MTALGNYEEGVSVYDDSNSTTVGGAALGAVKVFDFNKVPDMEKVRDDTDAPTGNRFLNSSIFSKAGLVIDLGDNGMMPNEPRERDTGFNNQQNFPVLSSTTYEGSTTVKGSLNSTSGKSFLVQFFSTPSGQQAKILIGQRSVRIDARGNASPIFSPPGWYRRDST